MRLRGIWIAVVGLGACAPAAQTEFSTGAVGPVARGVSCVAEEVQEAGWNVTRRDDDGFVRAESGSDWLEAQVVPGEQNQTHVVRVRTTETKEARDTAEDVLANCS